MYRFQRHKFHRFLTALACVCGLFFMHSFTVLADELTSEERLALHQAMPVQSNQIPNWPTGPAVGAESAILIEAKTGVILYEKNIHQREYPASTTKILTTLMATELCNMDEVVSFSHDAVFDTPRDSSHIAMDVGQELTMEQCMNAILIRSANEVSYAVAEHITKTTDWSVFAEMMNKRAKELGCLDSNFVNPNGLPDVNHYTTAYDLAMIGRSFFANEMLCKITLTRRMEFPATDKLPHGKLEVNHMEIIPGGKYAYEYLVGCKTGYTDEARSCLVSCAEKDGMRLICVVMKDEAPNQYEDTISLFNYGFSNFEKVFVSQTESKYNIGNDSLFYGGNDIFGSSDPFFNLNKDDFILLPGTAALEDTESTVSYETGDKNVAALINYTYHGANIGSIRVNFATGQNGIRQFDNLAEDSGSVIYVNVLRMLTIIAGIGAALLLFLLVKTIIKNYSFIKVGSRPTWRDKSSRRKR